MGRLDGRRLLIDQALVSIASKGGLAALTKSLAVELAPTIRVPP
jgi:hypothetical protein